MKLGFSLSPGGLLLPYHMGALASLEYNGYLTSNTPIAGSSAGSIAVASYGSGLKPTTVLDACISLSNECEALGGARGKLLPLLNDQMDKLITQERFEELQERPGIVGIGYKRVFPPPGWISSLDNKYDNYEGNKILQTKFDTREDLFRSVSHSCMFPFFSTNLPCNIEFPSSEDGIGKFLPALYVDGFFTVPRSRFGCPDFNMVKNNYSFDGDDDNIVEETVAISVFPQDVIGLNDTDIYDCISPSLDDVGGSMSQWVNYAIEYSSDKEMTQVYEIGYQNAEAWCRKQQQKKQTYQQKKTNDLIF